MYSTPLQSGIRPNWDHNLYETSLSQGSGTGEFSETISFMYILRALNVASKSPKVMRPATLPGAMEKIWYPASIISVDPERFEIIEDNEGSFF